jgi:hypothetical protein
MLEALDQEETVRAALQKLVAGSEGVDEEEMERSILRFCADLLERGPAGAQPEGLAGLRPG